MAADNFERESVKRGAGNAGNLEDSAGNDSDRGTKADDVRESNESAAQGAKSRFSSESGLSEPSQQTRLPFSRETSVPVLEIASNPRGQFPASPGFRQEASGGGARSGEATQPRQGLPSPAAVRDGAVGGARDVQIGIPAALGVGVPAEQSGGSKGRANPVADAERALPSSPRPEAINASSSGRGGLPSGERATAAPAASGGGGGAIERSGMDSRAGKSTQNDAGQKSENSRPGEAPAGQQPISDRARVQNDAPGTEQAKIDRSADPKHARSDQSVDNTNRAGESLNRSKAQEVPSNNDATERQAKIDNQKNVVPVDSNARSQLNSKEALLQNQIAVDKTGNNESKLAANQQNKDIQLFADRNNKSNDSLSVSNSINAEKKNLEILSKTVESPAANASIQKSLLAQNASVDLPNLQLHGAILQNQRNSVDNASALTANGLSFKASLTDEAVPEKKIFGDSTEDSLSKAHTLQFDPEAQSSKNHSDAAINQAKNVSSAAQQQSVSESQQLARTTVSALAASKLDSAPKAENVQSLSTIRSERQIDSRVDGTLSGKIASSRVADDSKSSSSTVKDSTNVVVKDFTIGNANGRAPQFNPAGRSVDATSANNGGKGSGDFLSGMTGRNVGMVPGTRPGDISASYLPGRSGDASGHRYLTGAEIGLLIAMAGIAKKRADQVVGPKEGCQKSTGVATDVNASKNTVTKEVNPNLAVSANNKEASSKLIASVTSKEVSNSKELTNTPPANREVKEDFANRRFPGKEITLSAVIALTGSTGKMKDIEHHEAPSTVSVQRSARIERTLASSVQALKSETTFPGLLPQAQVAAFADDDSSSKDSNERSLMELLPGITVALRARRKNDANDDDSTDGDETVEESDEAKSLINQRAMYQIKAGDTLTGIADSQLSDSHLGWLIADLNKNKLKESWFEGKRVVEIQCGEQLELPFAHEIMAFYEKREKHAVPNNLITIVLESSTRARKYFEKELSFLLGTKRGAC